MPGRSRRHALERNPGYTVEPSALHCVYVYTPRLDARSISQPGFVSGQSASSFRCWHDSRFRPAPLRPNQRGLWPWLACAFEDL
eukprot:56252-Pleurochrysis_carterae.AAC.1